MNAYDFLLVSMIMLVALTLARRVDRYLAEKRPPDRVTATPEHEHEWRYGGRVGELGSASRCWCGELVVCSLEALAYLPEPEDSLLVEFEKLEREVRTRESLRESVREQPHQHGRAKLIRPEEKLSTLHELITRELSGG